MSDGIDDVGKATLAREKYLQEKAIAEQEYLHGDEAYIPLDKQEAFRAERFKTVAKAEAAQVSETEATVAAQEPAPEEPAPKPDTMHAARRQPSERVTTSLGEAGK